MSISPYFIEVYATASYTLPGSYTNDTCRYGIISFTSSVPNSWFNTSTYIFTPLKAGYWQITAGYDIFRNSESNIFIRKNSTTVAAQGAISTVSANVTKVVYLNGSTDYIDVVNSGFGSNARTQSQGVSFFQAFLNG
jgi:hypothetical protein